MARGKSSSTYFDKLESDIKSNQSTLSLVLGALIVVVVGILVFNYFKSKQANLGPAQQTTAEVDVSPQNLPGKYIVKEDDTLFLIAQKYYDDGYQYPEIAKINKIANPNLIEKGQVLEIPKLELNAELLPLSGNTKWGPVIAGDIYTVLEGDWLSTIAGRAYGDMMSYQKIAAANNIKNPDLISPGMILKIPRT